MWENQTTLKRYTFNTFRTLQEIYKPKFKYRTPLELENNITEAELLHLIGLVNNIKGNNMYEIKDFCKKINLINESVDMYI